MDKLDPRQVPDIDSRYMGLAWFHAGFSKDPSTQVGAQIIDANNFPLGSGYNGLPRRIPDNLINWARPDVDFQGISKNDLVLHAEHNAIRHSRGSDLRNATVYVTALPCPRCMLELVEEEIARVVYYDFQSSAGSSLRNSTWRDKSFEIAKLGKIRVDKFEGDVNWINEWVKNLTDMGISKCDLATSI